MHKKLRLLARIWLIGILLSAGGCTTLGPDFEQPASEVTQTWLGHEDPAISTQEANYSDWWTIFNDPVLDSLVQTAYQQNLTLQVAGLRIYEARAQLGVAIGNQYPQLQQAAGALTRVNLSENEPNFSSLVDDTYWQANVGFDAAWELDFWGRFRRGVESSAASLGSEVANYDTALVSLTAEVARTYTVIRTVEERLRVARANVKSQQRSYQIADVKFRNGAVSELDPAQALTLLRSTESQVPSLESQLRQARNALSVLLGMPPQNLSAMLGTGTIPDAPPEVAVGIPADLLRRRPDVRFAELQAASQSALIGVARTELYPRLSLVGSLGYVTSDTNQSDLSDIFDSDSFTWSAGPSFSWPILNYGRLKNNVRLQDARYEQLIVNYQNTVLEAAQEVEDGLAGFVGAKVSTKFLDQSVVAATRAFNLALIQYREGAVDYQRVVDTQQSMLAAEQSYTNSRGEIALNLIATYKALGGGWEIREGKEFVSEARQKAMRNRTDWGDLIPGAALPDDLPEPPPTGSEQPLLNKPVW